MDTRRGDVSVAVVTLVVTVAAAVVLMVIVVVQVEGRHQLPGNRPGRLGVMAQGEYKRHI